MLCTDCALTISILSSALKQRMAAEALGPNAAGRGKSSLPLAGLDLPPFPPEPWHSRLCPHAAMGVGARGLSLGLVLQMLSSHAVGGARSAMPWLRQPPPMTSIITLPGTKPPFASQQSFRASPGGKGRVSLCAAPPNHPRGTLLTF